MNENEEADILENVANIAGLGRTIRSFKSAPERQAGVRAAKVALRSKVVNRNQAAFALKVNELDSNSIKQVQDGQLRIEKTSLFINKIVATGATFDATVELLRNPPVKAVGVTNFDDGKAPFNILVDKITVGVANAAALNVDAVQYLNVVDAGATGVPTGILNGEIEITAGGRTILPATPLSKFFAVGTAGSVNGGGSKSFSLNSPQWIKKGEQPQITIRGCANGAAFAANNTAISVDLEGLASLAQ